MALSDDVKSAVSLVATVAPLVEWDLRKSRPQRGDWWAPCPLHGEATASFHVTETGDAGGQFYCFGCQARGSVIDFVMQHRGLSFGDAVKALARDGGIGNVADPVRQAEIEKDAQARRDAAALASDAAAARGEVAARRIWADAVSGAPELAAYLTGRGVRLDLIGGVPPTLRYHPDLPARDGAGGVIHRGPCMVAAIGRRGGFVGVHRTWIDGPARARLPDGRAVPKQMLGRTGAIFGQPVMLTHPDPTARLIVGEGIETTLAGLAAHRHRRPSQPVTAEAALTLGALAGRSDPSAPAPGFSDRTGRPLPSPQPDQDAPGWLPPAAGCRDVLVLADPSEKCPQSAEIHGQRARAKLHQRGHAAALSVPLGRWDHGSDFADLAATGVLYD